MGNISFIVPTANKENFNIEYVLGQLKDNFPDFIFESDDKFNQITVRKKVKELLRDFVTDIYFNQDCYILDIDKDIEELEELKDSNIQNLDGQIEDLKKLKEIGYDPNNCIQMTYGRWNDDKSDIEFFIKDLFNAYLFDEGIHPEFMGPSYQRKPKTKIKSFFNFRK